MLNWETYFADTVAAGWRPVHPCTDARELATLEASGVMGDCIYPLLQEGDTIYVDRSMRPQSGDVVSFSLSSRGVEAQNSDLPPAQAPWKVGDRWCKLFGRRLDLDMLYDRHGSEATATLMSCESPIVTPRLHPVRNIRRNGRLLFAPDNHCSEIGLNAATVTAINTSGTAGAGITGFTGLINTGVVVNPSGPGYDCTVIVTATVQARQTVGTVGQIKTLVRFADDSVTYVSAGHEEPLVSSVGFSIFTLQWQFAHSKANIGVGQAGIWFDNTGPSTNSFDWQSPTIQVEYIIR